MSNQTVPMIDLAKARSSRANRLEVARQIDDVNSHIEFLALINHCVQQSLLDDIYKVTAEFFDQPVRYQTRLPRHRRGHQPRLHAPEITRTGQHAREDDTRRPRGVLLHWGTRRPRRRSVLRTRPRRAQLSPPNIWPDTPPAFRDIWSRYYTAMADLSAEVMQLFALALDLDEHYFDDKIDKPISNLFANHYPPLVEAPEPAQLRIGEHTDYGSLTLLYQKDEVGGLEVQLDGTWHRVDPIPGSFVINIGDLMARWTNDRWISTLHRVENPLITAAASRRISLPFFCQPNYDTLIEALPTCVTPDNPVRYEPITSGENVRSKTVKSFAVS